MDKYVSKSDDLGPFDVGEIGLSLVHIETSCPITYLLNRNINHVTKIFVSLPKTFVYLKASKFCRDTIYEMKY